MNVSTNLRAGAGQTRKQNSGADSSVVVTPPPVVYYPPVTRCPGI